MAIFPELGSPAQRGWSDADELLSGLDRQATKRGVGEVLGQHKISEFGHAFGRQSLARDVPLVLQLNFEYMHTLFFGRISGIAGTFYDYKAEFFHDYLVPVPSFAIGMIEPVSFCTQDSGLAPGDYGGALITELCQQNGFDLTSLKNSLIELDNLYQSGGGQVIVEGYQHPAATVAQYRDILNSLLGSDATGAFAAACWPPELFGNIYSPLPACIAPVESGTATPVK